MGTAEPKPPEGYRWLHKDEMVWPTDVRLANDGQTLLSANVMGRHFCPSTVDGPNVWMRDKVAQPDLAWLKAKALEQAKSKDKTELEQERIRWEVAQAVKAYSEALRKLVPEREQWRPDQRREGGEA